jgi:hypothetical protein
VDLALDVARLDEARANAPLRRAASSFASEPPDAATCVQLLPLMSLNDSSGDYSSHTCDIPTTSRNRRQSPRSGLPEGLTPPRSWRQGPSRQPRSTTQSSYAAPSSVAERAVQSSYPLEPHALWRVIKLGSGQDELLKRAADRWQSSARSLLRVLKGARTIAASPDVTTSTSPRRCSCAAAIGRADQGATGHTPRQLSPPPVDFPQERYVAPTSSSRGSRCPWRLYPERDSAFTRSPA